MDIVQKINNLNLPPRNFIVVGSGIMQVLGIRQSSDVDLIVSEEVFHLLGEQGWEHGEWPDQPVLKRDVFDVGTHWEGKRLAELLQAATTIEDVPFLSLHDLRLWKVNQARPKDLVDVGLIDEYLRRPKS